MCLHKNSFIALFCLLIFPVHGQVSVRSDSLLNLKPTDSLFTIPRDPLKAAGLIFTTNMGIWTFDRFVRDRPYARINFNTILHNFRTGFVGDNDGFLTNLLSHPYHGALYFNAARSNGMNFWHSVPFTAAGSLMWEFFMENEPASINDFISTTIGGTSLGEISFRISDRLIDNRTMGFERFKREALLTIISPIRGLNRILSGEAWKHRDIRGNSMPSTPVSFYSTIGYRFITDNSKKNNDACQMVSYDVGLDYGNPFDLENEKPYDFFSIKISGNLFSHQPAISRVNALGILFSKDIYLRKPDHQLICGIFQHFNLYQVYADSNKVSLNPYAISETASAGPGLLFKSRLTNNIIFSSSAHLSAILLGGNQCEHFNSGTRDYRMGSGFSSKLNFELKFGDKARLFLNAENYQIYSWIGNLPANTQTISSNTSEDIGYASFSLVILNLNYKISKHILLSSETGYYYRRNIYKYYPDVKHSIMEHKLSLGYIF
jgi:hypothetical protein